MDICDHKPQYYNILPWNQYLNFVSKEKCNPNLLKLIVGPFNIINETLLL